MVAISELLRVCYGLASPKNRAKAVKENALDRPQIAQTKSNQEAKNSEKRPAIWAC
jgi:hypothetical protein